jgi:hypothetical protein
MSDFILTRQRIRSGRYEGILTSRGRVKDEPELEMQFLGTSAGNVEVTPDEKTKRTWNIKAQIPLFSINEGVQTYVIRDAASEETLDSFAIVCGEPLQEDLRTEMALLRAELEMLKKSFWKHVVKTGE